MARNIRIGIDIGSSATKVVVASVGKELKILGTGLAESRGLRQGYITNFEEATKSIKKAIAEAEKNTGFKLRSGILALSGISLGAETGGGMAIISRADKEVTELDVTRAINESESNMPTVNKKILHVIPLQYKLDNQEVLGRPEGMRGIKLEVKTLFVTCLEQHLDDLVNAIGRAGVEVIDVVASPLALGLALLSDKQRSAGSVLIDIGADTTSVTLFENGNPTSLQILPIGSSDITKDLALGLRISLEEAENLKIGRLLGSYPEKKVAEIVEARFEDVFELVEEYLKKIGRSGLLPAGAILSGGGASHPAVRDLAKRTLKLPAEIGRLRALETSKKIFEPLWHAAASVALSDYVENEPMSSPFFGVVKKAFQSVINQLLP